MNRPRRRARGHRMPDRLGLIFVLGALVAAACTQRSGAGAGLDGSPVPSPTDAAGSSDIVAPTTPNPTNPPQSQKEACHGGANPGSKGMLSCGGEVGFEG